MGQRDINGKLILDFTLPDLSHIGNRVKGKTKRVKSKRFQKTIKEKRKEREEEESEVKITTDGILWAMRRSDKETMSRKEIRDQTRVYLRTVDYPYKTYNFHIAMERLKRDLVIVKFMALGKAYIHHKEHYRLV